MGSPIAPTEHQRIDAAISAIEQRTDADLCVVVTRVSDRYALYPVAYAAIGAIALVVLVSLVRPAIASRIIVLLQLTLLTLLTLLLDWLPLRLRIVPERTKHARAWQLAHREFNAHASAAPTPHRILLFVSLGERYVEIIADHETHALAPAGTWAQIVDEFLATVKAGRVADGVLHAVEACGAILTEHHPARAAS
jgi:putative membrane protein